MPNPYEPPGDQEYEPPTDQEPPNPMRRLASVVLLIVALTLALVLFLLMTFRSAGGLNAGDVAFGIVGTVVVGMLAMIAIV